MSADRLRGAAHVLRERAEAVVPGPWQIGDYGSHGNHSWAIEAIEHVKGSHVDGLDYIEAVHFGTDRPLVDFIATMHPGVALAIADWLDDEAEWVEADECYMHDKALAVADAILGGTK